MTQNIISNFSFKKPAIYKIKVQGNLNTRYTRWSERLGGLQIIVEKSGDKDPVYVLIGQISDQEALSGVLNTLYESQLSIISVNLLKDT